ncbi:S-adenosyl-L-methionine-dependent methyltransferase [Phellopilus nigrolimitatus]|nr:S-adenosyl-L-methionine-dependent methyltransferase [Phellopilus nigrolimitatus]
MASDLKALRDIISSSIDKIVGVCLSGIRNHPEVADSIGLIVAAAAFQLIATVQPPATTLTESASRFTLSSTLGIVEATNVAEIIRPAGSKGMHVKEIASKNGLDPKKLARILRYLATNHWFQEVTPDVFSHNLLSSLLDTGKEITNNFSEIKHKHSPGFAAIVGYGADERMKASVYMQDVLTDPETAFSGEVIHAGFQKGAGTTLSQWDYYGTPEGRYRGERFAVAMSGANKLHPPEAILSEFDWSTIPKGGLIVDVGGGTGHVALEIAKVFPELHVAIEDTAGVLEKAKEYWQTKLPFHISTGKVYFVETDFFEAQPTLPGTPDIFLLRMIVHDWSNKYVIKLLRRLRDVAGPSTKLIIVDSIVGYACDVPKKYLSDETLKPPAPLLPNMGGVNLLSYSVDMVIMNSLNSQERTIDGHTSVMEAAGWKLVKVHKNQGSKIWWPSLIAVPA